MPTILLAHPDAVRAEPLARALGASGWIVHRRPDAASALASAEKGRMAAALVLDALGAESGFALATQLRAAHPAMPVVMLCDPASPELPAHKASAAPARAYIDRNLAVDRIAAEVLRAVRTLPGVARPPSGAQAVMAALAELDAVQKDPARPPTPQGIVRNDVAHRAELEKLHARLRALELENLQLQQARQKQAAEHKLALNMRDEMVRHLELALEALTVDLTNVATVLNEQQDRAGQSEVKLEAAQGEVSKLKDEVTLAHELRKELAEARAQLLGAEMDAQGLRESLQRATEDVQGLYQRTMEAEAQRTDLIRALEQARARADIAQQAAEEHHAALDSARRDADAERQHHGDVLTRLKKKLQTAEDALEKLAPAQASRASGS